MVSTIMGMYPIYASTFYLATPAPPKKEESK